MHRQDQRNFHLILFFQSTLFGCSIGFFLLTVMNASLQFCLPVLLLFLFEKATSNRDTTISLFSNFRPSDVSLDSNSVRLLNGTEKDEDNVELGVISLQNLKHILNNVKQIQRFLNLLLRLQKVSKESERLRKQPLIAERLYRYIHVYTMKQYLSLHRLINLLPRLKLVTSKRLPFHPVLVYPKVETTNQQLNTTNEGKIKDKKFRERRERQEKWTLEIQPKHAVENATETKASTNLNIENVETSTDSNQGVVTPKNTAVPTLYETSKNASPATKHTPTGNKSYLPTNEQNTVESLSKNMDKILDLETNNGDEEFMNDFIADLDRAEMAEAFQTLVNSRSKDNVGLHQVPNH